MRHARSLLTGRLTAVGGGLAFAFVSVVLVGLTAPCPRAANAYQPGPLPGSSVGGSPVAQEFQLTPDEWWTVNNGMTSTRAADPALASKSESMLSRILPKSMPRMTPWLMRAGLATAAAGIWIHNGLTLYAGLTQGGNHQITYDGQYAQAPAASRVTGKNPDGSNGTVAFIGDAKWTNTGSRGSLDLTVYRSPASFLCGLSSCDAQGGFFDAYRPTSGYSYGMSGPIDGTSSYNATTVQGAIANVPKSKDLSGGPDTSYKWPDPIVWHASVSTTKVSDCAVIEGTNTPSGSGGGVITQLCGASASFSPPVYDVEPQLARPPEYTPPAGDFVSTPQETRSLADAMKASPEYNPTWDPDTNHKTQVEKLTPQHGPEEWTTENPDGSKTTRLRDGTEVTTWPDGTTRVTAPDGTEDWQYPDGVKRHYNPDTGEETTTYPDGTTRTRTYPPGTPPEQLTSTTPITDQFRDPSRNPESAPTDTTKYPDEQPKTPTTGSGGTSQGSDKCATPRGFDFEIPKVELGNVFPFVLVIRAWEWMQALGAASGPPSFDLGPPLGVMSFPASWSGYMSAWRAAVSIVVGIGMSFWFYRYISGKGSDSGGGSE